MSAPTGVKASRWNQAVNRIVSETGMTSPAADLWLNAVWLTMFTGDELAGQMAAHDRLRVFLEFNQPTAPTLPTAFYRWATA